MKTKKCPCEECISFAICYHHTSLECELLYKYLRDVDDFKDHAHLGYRVGTTGAIHHLYNRYISSTMYPDSITLTGYRCKK